MSPRTLASELVVIGLSHKSAPVDVRERFFVGETEVPALLKDLQRRPEIAEAMFLSTCNRVEIFARATHDSPRALSALREVLAGQAGLRANELSSFTYEREGEHAIRHIFRVTSSLESMVLGEPQILGQVKGAYETARKNGTLSTVLDRCVTRAFAVAKRVRTETALGQGNVSISSVAVDLARGIFGDLEGHSVLLVGAGEMAEAAAKSLGKGARSIRVCNRSFERAATLAKTFGGTAAPLDQLEEELVLADIVVVSTASKNYVVGQDMVKRVMRRRRGKTLFFVDISVPRNVDPTAHTDVDNCFVYNVDDLEDQVREGMRARAGEALAAERIVEHELHEWDAYVRGLSAQPTVVALRARTRGVLQSELSRTLTGRLKHLSDDDRVALEQMLDAAVNKLLHAPTTKLKGSDGGHLASAARELFDLEPSASNSDDEPADQARVEH